MSWRLVPSLRKEEWTSERLGGRVSYLEGLGQCGGQGCLPCERLGGGYCVTESAHECIPLTVFELGYEDDLYSGVSF